MPVIEVNELGLFRFKNVLGDGNCLFNALVISKDINMECPIELREFMVDQLLGNIKAKRLYDSIVNDMEFESWLKDLSR